MKRCLEGRKWYECDVVVVVTEIVRAINVMRGWYELGSEGLGRAPNRFNWPRAM